MHEDPLQISFVMFRIHPVIMKECIPQTNGLADWVAFL